MLAQCEQILSERLSNDTAIVLYYHAVSHEANGLRHAAASFILKHYAQLDDPHHEALLHLLESLASASSASTA